MPYLGLRGTPLLYAISATAGIGFCLFGIDNASLGGVIASDPFTARFHLDPTGQGAVTGAYELGCFAGALVVMIWGERISRRAVLFVSTVPLMIGATLQVASFGVAQLSVGRVVAGLGMGGITSVLPIWQNETSPAHLRGTLVCCSLSFLIVGQLVGYWAAYGLLENYNTDLTWRVEFSLQMMAGALMVAMLAFMPESPRWLLAHGRPADARHVLSCLLDLNADSPEVEHQAAEIENAITLEAESAKSWTDLFKQGDKTGEKRRMLTAVFVQGAQALSGSTVISYYVTPIFQDAVGLTPHLATLLSGFLQIWFLLCSFLTWWLIERAGRRFLFMATAFGMSVVMFIMGGMIHLNTHGAGIAAAAMIFLYQSFFTWGWMAGVWVYSSEICPLSWRSKGMGLAVAVQWLLDFVMLMVTPIGIANIGYAFFFIFAIFNLCYIPCIYFFCPETAGIPLESIDKLYYPGVDPVKESSRLRKSLRHAHGEQALNAAGLGRIGKGRKVGGEVEMSERAES